MANKIVPPYPAEHDHGQPEDMFDLGLQADTNMMKRSEFDRRKVLTLGLAGIGALMVGCGSSSTTSSTSTTSSSSSTDTSTSTSTSTSSSCSAQPTETAGPYPADGSSASGYTYNVLDDSYIVRSDIRTSNGTSNTADGVKLTLTLTLVNVNNSCAALSGYVLYIWHCNAAGEYSLYSSDLVSEDYLRGVQVTDSNGQVTFTTIVPGCYLPRWPHIHFEVYSSLSAATTGNVSSNCLLVSQLAVPTDVCSTVYQDSRYSQSKSNFSQVSLSGDQVFSDGYSTQLLTMSGSVSAGYTGSMIIGLKV